MSTVLVTGGSGFIGSHCIVALLAAGHTVRTTVRSLQREPELRALLRQGGADPGERLRFFAADLERDEGWLEAARGCEYVLHVASPYPPKVPNHEDELIVPAREGTLRVLRAARDAGVRRVVLTSSFAAIGYGHPPSTEPFDETSWTNVDDPGTSAYAKSKTLAERAAWDFLAREGGALELSVVNPVAVYGPVLGDDISSSVLLVQQLLEGVLRGCPKIYFGVVDVRDVVDLHLRAMVDPAARGERFLCVAGDFVLFADVAAILKRRLGDAALKVPTRELPSRLLQMTATPEAQQLVPELDRWKNGTSAKAARLLGWRPRTAEEAIVATAESLFAHGLVRGVSR